ncbi:P-II family nitrogen regulator [Cutibacterium avidum]|uniref:P-II family nitrogen regulator n=1 Tax=Cutibacterium avidum TaxID=33010 RepID=UPI0008F55E4A|nr:P-II family nitrogen regulator [Cutibacterium avidum]MDK7697727.1 P-II family nitrogen regulator [Cutibacterium avidum]MDQ9080184.1 P-II family nitrogen regulator [Cutibacterium avidum]OIJ79518.1 transcriptional regulator [Cutibacterium avidum]
MKLITAIIQPSALDTVRLELAKAGVSGLTISEAAGCARQKGHTEVYRGAEFTIDFLEKVRVEVLCTDEEFENVVETICDAARTGEIGDGKVWASEVQDVIRIRTRERGPAAI